MALQARYFLLFGQFVAFRPLWMDADFLFPEEISHARKDTPITKENGKCDIFDFRPVIFADTVTVPLHSLLYTLRRLVGADITPPSSQSSMALNSPVLPKMAPLNALKNRSLGNLGVFRRFRKCHPGPKSSSKGHRLPIRAPSPGEKNPHVPPKVNNSNARHSPRKTTRNYVRTNNRRRRRRPTTPFVVISPIVCRGGKTSSASPYH